MWVFCTQPLVGTYGYVRESIAISSCANVGDLPREDVEDDDADAAIVQPSKEDNSTEFPWSLKNLMPPQSALPEACAVKNTVQHGEGSDAQLSENDDSDYELDS